ncbi:MAG: transposase [Alicyclobacillus sp.]|nr:transposase [Alicyclobacillus sp.]
MRTLVRQLEDGTHLEFCYEAGPTGYRLYRLLRAMNLACTVVAPSLIPIRQGEPVKTDRRNALRLAQLFRAGELVPVYVPDEENESLRVLVRAREDAVEDRLRARHRLSKFLLRHNRHPESPVRIQSQARPSPINPRFDVDVLIQLPRKLMKCLRGNQFLYCWFAN